MTSPRLPHMLAMPSFQETLSFGNNTIQNEKGMANHASATNNLGNVSSSFQHQLQIVCKGLVHYVKGHIVMVCREQK